MPRPLQLQTVVGQPCVRCGLNTRERSWAGPEKESRRG